MGYKDKFILFHLSLSATVFISKDQLERYSRVQKS